MLNVSALLRNPTFAQRVQVLRGTGQYLPDGTWTQGYVLEEVTAIIHPVKPDDLQLLPEGAHHLPSKKIMSLEVLQVADVLLYPETHWRIAQLFNWSDYGYYHGIGVRHDGLGSRHLLVSAARPYRDAHRT
ncbi:hypothetical protein LPH50_11350 [Xylella taiwanensis]|uniref:Uncharacterized protein n=1 Tax=Xylella taiwanensis TaxID=1444770 RepID=Z9JHP0_9GAMM|nr:hypothetical protein [Xylella taiwanensis]EWS77503.1 hypothetical protein AF72_10700 [Xylella taiwanensis]MCD8456519.1 hypothetical protein [Xylella taiwanensis]MCD8458926.1 hypothetical protein [Xylella taiwanensis]MCD8461064.1 hypothetical protein [Xylella taiwanensis]MCD8462877.1 hypothetical protein [Xylella taiwanensis]